VKLENTAVGIHWCTPLSNKKGGQNLFKSVEIRSDPAIHITRELVRKMQIGQDHKLIISKQLICWQHWLLMFLNAANSRIKTHLPSNKSKLQPVNLAAIHRAIALNAIRSSSFLTTLRAKQQYDFLPPTTHSTTPTMRMLPSMMTMLTTTMAALRRPVDLAAIQRKLECKNERFSKFIANLRAIQQQDTPTPTTTPMKTTPPPPTTTMPTTTTAALPNVTQPIIESIHRHLKTLDRFDENIKQLRQSMAKLDAVLGRIILARQTQPTIDNRLIVSATANAQTLLLGHAPCPSAPPRLKPAQAITLPSETRTFRTSPEPRKPSDPDSPIFCSLGVKINDPVSPTKSQPTINGYLRLNLSPPVHRFLEKIP